MELECSCRLVTLFVRNSFKRPVRSHLLLGINSRDPLEPLLVLATSTLNLEFKVTGNIKRIYKKEVCDGRVGIEFYNPPHQLLIAASTGELHAFLELLCQLMDRTIMERMEFIPIVDKCMKPNTKTKFLISKSCNENDKSMCRTKKKPKDISINLKKNFSKYLIEIDLPDCNLREIPVELGEIQVEFINLENNKLTSTSLSWLDELSLRRSLKYLNLADNMIDNFPSVLIEFHSLISLNLRDNSIESIPGCIDELRTLKYLNLSGNNLRYLPANFKSLKLSEVDLTYNYLTNNLRDSFHPKIRGTSKKCLALKDIAVISVEPSLRRELTTKFYPRSLLENLRHLSKCVCGRKTVPHTTSQFYEMLFRIGFALTYKIHPQKLDFADIPLRGIRHKGDGTGNVFLQFHFCPECEDEYFQYGNNNEFCCYRLLPDNEVDTPDYIY